jgi:DTW domain-containing protein YfiP
LQHFSEARRQSNTGRLTARMVEGSEVLPWGWPGRPFDPAAFADSETDYRVLYPRQDARILCPEIDRPAPGRTLALVLLDATWSQTRSMSRRVPGLSDLPFVRLPDGQPPRWELRRSPDRVSFSTLEAAIRAVEVLESPEAARPMGEVLERVMLRSFQMRGKIRRSELERREAEIGKGTGPSSLSTEARDRSRLL